MDFSERVIVIVLAALALSFGIFTLNRYLNRLNEPAIALSMLIIAGSAALLEWVMTSRQGSCRR